MIVKMGYMLQKEERRMGGGNVSQDQTSIICIDLKSFYASVECVERWNLKIIARFMTG